MNYFSLFSLPVRYDLDTQALAGRYQDLQRQYHPTDLPPVMRKNKRRH